MNVRIMNTCRICIKDYRSDSGKSYEAVMADSGGYFKSEGTLRNLVSPACEQNPLRFNDVVEIFEITRDLRIANAIADEFGGLFMPLDVQCMSVSNLVDAALSNTEKSNHLCREIHTALGDNRIDARERKAIKALLAEKRSILAEIEATIDKYGE